MASSVISEDTEDQKKRSSLRLGFLAIMEALHDRDLRMVTAEKNEISGVYKCCDREFGLVGVADLVTPFEKLDSAIVRTQDVNKLVFSPVTINEM